MPAGHCAQEALLALPNSVPYVSRAQGAQASAPGALANVPGAHAAQAEACGRLEAVPGAQGRQALSSLVPPALLPYRPSGQLPLQLDCPGLALN